MTEEQANEIRKMVVDGDPTSFPRWFTGDVTINGERTRVVEGVVQWRWSGWSIAICLIALAAAGLLFISQSGWLAEHLL